VLLLAAVALVAVVGALVAVDLAGSSGPAPAVATAGTPVSGLPTIRLADLPVPARQTVALIDQGGPFPYRQDGTVFNNAEGRLPARPTGYYREYTVTTPGSSDRGTRRLILGQRGDLYYTADHYATFRQVLR
jgi:ribonuclease T1